MTINEALIRLKSLRERQTELVSLRNANAVERRRFLGHTDKEHIETPLYDVKALDRLVTTVGTEIRVLETAVKVTNASVEVIGYMPNADAFANIE